MLAILALFLQPSLLEPRTVARPAGPVPIASQGPTEQRPVDLKPILRQKFAALDASRHGVFHEDVTADVAPLFPVGQPFHETQRIVRAQNLGDLKRFKGQPHSGTTMYVAHFTLVPDAADNVYAVIDFDFDGATEADMRLKSVRAFLRASNM